MAGTISGTPTILGSKVQQIAIIPAFGVSATETYNLNQWFARVAQANYYPTTGAGTLGATMTITTNTTVTIPTSPAVDDGYIVAYGAPVAS